MKKIPYATAKSAESRRGQKYNKISSICLICKETFLCSRNYKGQKFAFWDCRMSSAALELGFTCPITNTIMFSPTTASDGQCYERHAIQVWIATAVDNAKQPLSPVSGKPLSNLVLRADTERLRKIEEFVVKNKLQQHPDRVKPPNSSDIVKRQLISAPRPRSGSLRLPLARMIVAKMTPPWRIWLRWAWYYIHWHCWLSTPSRA